MTVTLRRHRRRVPVGSTRTCLGVQARLFRRRQPEVRRQLAVAGLVHAVVVQRVHVVQRHRRRRRARGGRCRPGVFLVQPFHRVHVAAVHPLARQVVPALLLAARRVPPRRGQDEMEHFDGERAAGGACVGRQQRPPGTNAAACQHGHEEEVQCGQHGRVMRTRREQPSARRPCRQWKWKLVVSRRI